MGKKDTAEKGHKRTQDWGLSGNLKYWDDIEIVGTNINGAPSETIRVWNLLGSACGRRGRPLRQFIIPEQ